MQSQLLTLEKSFQIQETPFVDFGTTRTQSLRNAEEFLQTEGKLNENAFLLVMDADDVFHAREDFAFSKYMNPQSTSIQFSFVRGTYQFLRTQMFKADSSWTQKGVLHEQCSSLKDTCPTTISKDICYFDANTAGCRSQDPHKYAKDALLLQKALENEPDNERQIFYLAQSQKDSSQNELAIKYYMKRWSMKRWCEEQFYSAVQLTMLLKSSEWAWRSLDACPDRAEALVAQMSHCRATNQWSQELQAMAFQAFHNFHGKIPNRLLFLDMDVQTWKILDEFSIIAQYTGHLSESRSALLQLINENKFPIVHRDRIINNFSFFNEILSEKNN